MKRWYRSDAEGEGWRYIACTLYTAAAVTDYLDGYFARAWKQQSKLGRIFDPIADKLLVASTILLLVAFQRVAGFDVLAALVSWHGSLPDTQTWSPNMRRMASTSSTEASYPVTKFGNGSESRFISKDERSWS